MMSWGLSQPKMSKVRACKRSTQTIAFVVTLAFIVLVVATPFVAVHLKWPISSSEVAWAPHDQFIKANVDSNKKIAEEPPPHIEFDLRGSTLIVQHFRKYFIPPACDAY